MTFRFLAPAQAELLEAIVYYATIRAELGVRFKEAAAAPNYLCRMPENRSGSHFQRIFRE